MTAELVKNKTENLSKVDYSVLVEQKEGGYTAIVWGLPNCQVFAATREEALSKLHQVVNNRLQNVEIVTQEIEVPSSNHRYSVLVERNEGAYTATVWGLPDYQVSAITREEALSKLHQVVNNRLKNVEIVTQEIEAPSSEHPWMKFAGVFKDDPTFDEVQAHIAEYRRELDAEMEEYYRQMDAEEGQA